MATDRNRSSPYQPTTEERLRASNEGLTCIPWGARRNQEDYDLESTETTGEGERQPW